MYPRKIYFDQVSGHSIFLFGPRGTGKTSWLKGNFPRALFFDLLNSEIYTEFIANPALLESRIPDGFDDWIIIDEVQRIPMLLNEVHRLIESKKYKFILTGSSARSLRKKGVNLLAGRALTYYMHPLIIDEIGNDFDLQCALQMGMLPKVFHNNRARHYLSSYVQTYLKEEVQQEALTRNIGLFSRFLQTASFSQGEEINYTSIAREIGATRQTVSNFFDILEDLLLSVQLTVFNKRAKRALTTKNKFYYFDVGVYQTIRPKGPLDSADGVKGAALETLFLQHIRAINHYKHLNYEIFYWRTRAQMEVDFILYGENGLYAFEVKNKRTLQQKDFKGLKLFYKDYPVAKCYVIYTGARAYYENNITVLPIQSALEKLEGILF